MNQITDLLNAWINGDQQAFDKLMPLIDPELKKIAHSYMRNEKPSHLLQTTALVNEALIKLLPEDISYENRRHFYGFVALRMRRVLIDYARKQSKAKREGWQRVDMDEAQYQFSEKSQDLILLDQALTKLADIDKRQASIVECRYFIGWTAKEVAQLLGMSQSTVDREWSFARSWLKHEMRGDAKK